MDTDQIRDTDPAPAEALDLMDQALADYAAMVFWNMSPSRTVGGVRAAARALETRGDLRAAMLARKMKKALNAS